jgi:hypothetical protein
MGKNQNTWSHKTSIIFREIKIIIHPLWSLAGFRARVNVLWQENRDWHCRQYDCHGLNTTAIVVNVIYIVSNVIDIVSMRQCQSHWWQCQSRWRQCQSRWRQWETCSDNLILVSTRRSKLFILWIKCCMPH